MHQLTTVHVNVLKYVEKSALKKVPSGLVFLMFLPTPPYFSPYLCLALGPLEGNPCEKTHPCFVPTDLLLGLANGRHLQKLKRAGGEWTFLPSSFCCFGANSLAVADFLYDYGSCRGGPPHASSSPWGLETLFLLPFLQPQASLLWLLPVASASFVKV